MIRSSHFVTLTLGLVALVAGPLVGRTRAHDWYDYSCCAERDCRPAAVGEVEIRSGGYFVRSVGETIPRDDARVKPGMDWDWHICLAPDDTVRCLYRPGGGV